MPLPTTFAGGSAAGFLPFLDDFDRSNGALGAPWQSGGSTWAISSNEATNTPTEDNELVTNGDFANWTGDDPDSWTLTPGDDANHEVCQVGTGQAHAACGGAGVGFCNIWRSGGAGTTTIYQTILTRQTWYVIDLTVDTNPSGGLVIQDTNGGIYYVVSGAGDKTVVGRALHEEFKLVTNSDPADITIDDVSVKALTLNTLFSSVDTSTTDVICQTELDTVVANTHAGLVLNLDSVSSPANFVIAYHDGTNAVLEKCVAGTYTSVISAAAAYAAGAIIQVIKSGTSYSLYYNGAQVGVTSTINDAGIISNTLHGMFSTYSGNQLDNFQCEKN